MSPTRILVADMPRLVREIVMELLRGCPDVEVLEGDAAAAQDAEVVILGRDDAAEARALLEARPRLLVLTVAGQAFDVCRYDLIPHRERLGELSPAVLTTGVRRLGPPAPWWTD